MRRERADQPDRPRREPGFVLATLADSSVKLAVMSAPLECKPSKTSTVQRVRDVLLRRGDGERATCECNRVRVQRSPSALEGGTRRCPGWQVRYRPPRRHYRRR